MTCNCENWVSTLREKKPQEQYMQKQKKKFEQCKKALDTLREKCPYSEFFWCVYGHFSRSDNLHSNTEIRFLVLAIG